MRGRIDGESSWAYTANSQERHPMIDVVMPQLGEDIAEGTVSRWFVREGDVVDRDQTLLEVETSKADVELPSPTKGVVVSIVAPVGAVVPKQGLLCRIDETATG